MSIALKPASLKPRLMPTALRILAGGSVAQNHEHVSCFNEIKPFFANAFVSYIARTAVSFREYEDC